VFRHLNQVGNNRYAFLSVYFFKAGQVRGYLQDIYDFMDERSFALVQLRYSNLYSLIISSTRSSMSQEGAPKAVGSIPVIFLKPAMPLANHS